jgi:hypothetical protein
VAVRKEGVVQVAQRRRSREAHLVDLLLAGRMSVEAVSDVVEAGLGAYALERLGEHAGDHSALLRSSRLMAGVRHSAIRRAVVELIGAWNDAGLDTLLYKGFYLAEFVYPDPSWRAYADVDLAVRSRTGADPRLTARLATDVARDLGFTVVWHVGEEPSVHSFHDQRYDGHELAQLIHPGTGVSVDAHRRLVHSNVSLRPQTDAGEVLTDRVWDAARTLDLGGVPAFEPAPIDSALVGLIAGRSWSGDRYALKPHDFLDLQILMRYGGFGREDMVSRARTLGLAATTKLFLSRCDPEAGVIDLPAPGWARVFAYDTLLAGERSHRGLAQAWAATLAAPGRARDIVRELPAAIRQAVRMRAGSGPTRPEPVEGPGGKPLDRRTWRATQVGVRRALKLLGLAPERNPELARACLHGSVARRGYAVSRVDVDGQTTFEYQGRALPLDQLGLSGEAKGQAAPSSTSGHARTPSTRPPQTRPPPTTPSSRLSSRLSTKMRRLMDMGWPGIWLRIEAFFLLRRIHAALGSKPFTEVRADLLRGRSATHTGAVGDGSARAHVDDGTPLGRAVESAARYVPGALCVAQALAGQVMLARRGSPSTIHFGFLRSKAGAVEGHAWLEVDGAVVVGDGPLEDFTRTATFES